MSSKSDIIYSENGTYRIYEETNSPQYVLSVFKGFDVEIILSSSIIKSLDIEGELLTINITKDSSLFNITPILVLNFINITSFKMDEDDLMITIKGGSYIAKKLSNKEFRFLG